MRIVSLLPSATEIVCALGATSDLVGISHECDYPPDIRDRTVLTSSRIHHGSSAAIDAAVRDVIANALSIYAVDDAALARLAPDVIITQDLCEVCAVSLDDVRAAVARLSHRTDIRIVALSPTRLADVLDDLLRVGDAISRRPAATLLRASLSSRTSRPLSRLRHPPRLLAPPPRLTTTPVAPHPSCGLAWRSSTRATSRRPLRR